LLNLYQYPDGRRLRRPGSICYCFPMDFLSEAKRWIGRDTVTTRSNRDFVSLLERRFAPLGFNIRRQTVRSDGVLFQNFLAFRGPSGSKPLLLNTHTDTVPPGPRDRWTQTNGNPWRATLKGGRLYGLGVADVKLNLLCQWEALRRIGRREFRRPLVVAGTFGEETGLLGAKTLVAGWRGHKPFLALVGEPSEMKPIHRHRGYLVFQWTLPAASFPHSAVVYTVPLTGASAHSSTPYLGENAIEKAFPLLRALERAKEEVAVAYFEGGTAANQVPAEAVLRVAAARPSAMLGRLAERASPAKGVRTAALPWRALASAADGLRRSFSRPGYSTNIGEVATLGKNVRLTFDVRFPPEDKARDVVGAVKKILTGASAAGIVKSDVLDRGGGQVAASRQRGLPLTATGAQGKIFIERDNPGLSSDPSGRAAAFLSDALTRSGLPADWTEKKTCTEAGLYSRWGVPAFVLGPGRSQGNIHRPNESVAVADLRRAVRFYKTLVESWCLTRS